MEAASTAASGTLLPCVHQKASNRHAWLEWVVKGNPPFSFVEMESPRRYTNLTPVCEETITLDMDNVTKAVERSIGHEPLEQFGAILDGWTNASEHYLAVHACYDRNGAHHCPLIYMAPIINGTDDRLNAECHMSALASFLSFFGKDLSNVMFLVGDNCAVNKRLARLMGVPLVGCASHRLNLVVRHFLEPYEEEREQVQSLMKRLRTINQAAKDTCWGSIADDEELVEEMPSPATNYKLKALLGQVADAQSVAMKLQCEELNLLDARDLLNGLLEVMPSFGDYLTPNTKIVHSSDFESGVVKVL
ncbi:hypothetical protein PC112_g22265 [Phytophthora cactorum]|nr:hypothetical protein PC112_g22265 [Phytophthora cactorum]